MPGLDAVQSSLKPGEAVLDFALLTGEPGRTGEADYAVLVITHKGVKRCAEINARALSTAVRDFYAVLDTGSDTEIQNASSLLHQLVFSALCLRRWSTSLGSVRSFDW